MKILRSVLAIFAGMIAAALVITMIEVASHLIFPPPPEVDWNDPEAMKAVMAKMPAGVFFLVLVAWGVGTLAGAWVAARLAPRAPLAHALIIGVLFLLTAVATMLALPHPIWVWLLALAIFLPAAYLGARLAKPKPLPASL